MEENFSFIPPWNEGMRVAPQSLSQLEVREPNFHTSSLVTQTVPLSPTHTWQGGQNGRAIGLGVCIAGSMFFQLCQGGCSRATWELPLVLAGMKDQRGWCAHGIKTVKESETPSSWWCHSFLISKNLLVGRSLAEAHFIDKKTWVQWREGTYPKTAISFCWKALLMSPHTFLYFEERSPRLGITVVPRNL